MKRPTNIERAVTNEMSDAKAVRPPPNPNCKHYLGMGRVDHYNRVTDVSVSGALCPVCYPPTLRGAMRDQRK
jgi:hypothetical protein